jgi:hypothetical protein
MADVDRFETNPEPIEERNGVLQMPADVAGACGNWVLSSFNPD